MRVLLDTNIRVRLAEGNHSAHLQAAQAVETLHNAGHELFLVPQNIYEFWAVATRPVDRNGLGRPIAETNLLVDRFSRLFRLLRDERAIFPLWHELVSRYSVQGVQCHDARLAAAMSRHGITHLLTFNGSDFRRFGHVTVLEPHAVVADG